MPRIRTIKPEFWSSPGIEDLPFEWRLLFIAMWNWADDYGRGTAEPRELMGFAFPRDENMTLGEFRRGLDGIRRVFGVKFYKVARRPYYCIPSWGRHQKVDKRSKSSRYPAPEDGQPFDPLNGQVISDNTESSMEPAEDSGEPAEVSGNFPPWNRGTGEQGNRGTDSQYLDQTFDFRTSGSQTDGSIESDPPAKPKPRRPKDPPEFTEFWKTYPRKVGKDRARKAFASACRRATAEEIIEGAKRLAADPNLPDKQFIPHPTTWLNGGGWDDEPLPDRTPSRPMSQRKTVTEQAEEVARQLGLTPEMPGQGSQIIDADIIDQKELGA
ncbi:hypothetical protein [Corynebacterium parakroppenstedtii]|uniref:hypothetical protein n=1 Tax=Corynebacterium parakroppenstedtii TaxID=2828363 RepID=UPI001C8CF73A|nr:hypothetical protein [Corynebacterium parakroppenstedtii]MBY0797852.1 hypothetical protein [Corynebacterium parakroppenstedtii]